MNRLESSAAQDAETVAPQATDLPTAPAEPEGEALPAGPAARLSDLLTRLPDMSSQSFIDNAALEFIPLNSKAARNRLVKVRKKDSHRSKEIYQQTKTQPLHSFYMTLRPPDWISCPSTQGSWQTSDH